MSGRLRIGMIGTGQRGVNAYGKLLSTKFSNRAELVALSDVNHHRLEGAMRLLGLDNASAYVDYHRILDDPAIEAVIVTTPDFTHGTVASEAMKAGKHVLCEKPLATTVEGCQQILEQRRDDRVLQVGFVLRYNRVYTHAKKLIVGGAIGNVKQVVAIDNRQGGDYFRRWHRFRDKSGGLLNHKSTHLLDIVNWLADGFPIEVSASGGVSVYQPGTWQGDRCLTCPSKQECPEALDLRQEPYRSLYLEAETVDGYIRDTCVFTSEKTTVDHAAAIVRFDNGVTASYTLSLFAPLDTRQILVFGDGGRLELDETTRSITVRQRYSADDVTYRLGHVSGGHDGGDDGLLDEFLTCVSQNSKPLASAQAGDVSCLLSLAAERSLHERRPLTIQEMLDDAEVAVTAFSMS